MDVALVGERVVPRQWEVGGGENEDECTASPIDMISHSLTGIASSPEQGDHRAFCWTCLRMSGVHSGGVG